VEPYRLRRWRPPWATSDTRLFSCARPGRSKGSAGLVADALVDQWVVGLPGPRPAIVSLLGCKPDGTSEFAFYSFGSCREERSSRRPSFQEWLDEHHKAKQITVIEHPTIDFTKIPDDVLSSIRQDLENLMMEGRTVILVDSGGITRTGDVFRRILAIEDTTR